MDLGRAPLLDVHAAAEPGGAWLALVRVHHLVVDHTAVDLVTAEVAVVLAGRAGELPVPVPFRDFVAQARLGISREEHEAYFAGLLGDVTEPTAAFGITDVHGDGSGTAETRRRCRRRWRRGSGTRPGSGGCPRPRCGTWCGRGCWRAVSGRDDVVFGTVLLGRMHAGTGRGRCRVRSSTRCRCGRMPGRPGAGALAGMQARLAGLLAHEHAPLSLAQQASGVVAPAPLFTTLFNYRHSAVGRARAGRPGWMASRRCRLGIGRTTR